MLTKYEKCDSISLHKTLTCDFMPALTESLAFLKLDKDDLSADEVYSFTDRSIYPERKYNFHYDRGNIGLVLSLALGTNRVYFIPLRV